MRVMFVSSVTTASVSAWRSDSPVSGIPYSVDPGHGDRMCQDVERSQTELILAPMLNAAIPEAVRREHLCLIVHPGLAGDRRPSSLDWAIAGGESCWGVTVLQAIAEMHAGPIWATETFSMLTRASHQEQPVPSRGHRGSGPRRTAGGCARGRPELRTAAPGLQPSRCARPTACVDAAVRAYRGLVQSHHRANRPPGPRRAEPPGRADDRSSQCAYTGPWTRPLVLGPPTCRWHVDSHCCSGLLVWRKLRGCDAAPSRWASRSRSCSATCPDAGRRRRPRCSTRRRSVHQRAGGR